MIYSKMEWPNRAGFNRFGDTRLHTAEDLTGIPRLLLWHLEIRMKRKSVRSVSMLLLLLMLTGLCITGAVSAEKGTLRVAEMWDISSIDPAKDGTTLTEKAIITETLVGAAADFSLTPQLATSWKNVDANTWEFTLRDGVLFHDGSPLNANAVMFSLDRAMEIDANLKGMVNYASSEVVDEKTIRIKTTDPNPVLPAFMHYPNTAIISSSSVDSSGKVTKPIGTGPMAFKEFNELTKTLTMSANPSYWGGKPGFETLVIRGIPDPNTRALAIENGEVDFTADIPYSETDAMDAKEGITVEKYDTPRLYRMDLNMKQPILQDKAVRQAISSAIDRSDIAENVLYNVGSPAIGPFLPTMKWANKNLKATAYDPAKASALLDEAGWKDTDGDGIRDKGGKKLELTLLTYTTRPGLPPMSEAVAAQLKDVGIKVNAKAMEYGAMKEKIDAGEWDLYLVAYNMAMVPDPAYVIKNWYTTGGSSNTGKYSNPDLDNAISAAEKIEDESARYQAFNKIQDTVMDELPIIPVAYYGVAIVKKDSVKGYEFDPTAHDYRINPGMTIE